MHNLPFDQQLQILLQRAASRNIEADDRYLQAYPVLLHSIQGLLPLNQQRLLLVAHAIFGWMPTQLEVNMELLDAALVIVTPDAEGMIEVSAEQLAQLASIFQTANGKSVVAASKLLHFIAPTRFPIWDKFVAENWGRTPNGPQAPENYHGFIQACRQFALHPEGQNACGVLHQHLAHGGYNYPMTEMRLLELMLFMPPR